MQMWSGCLPLVPGQHRATVNLKAADTPKSQGILQPELRLEAPLFLLALPPVQFFQMRSSERQSQVQDRLRDT